MSNRRILAAAAAAAALGVPSLALAQGSMVRPEASPPSSVISNENLPRRPIMSLLDQTPVGRQLDSWGIDIYGHVEGGYTYNFDPPASGQNAFRLFDFQDEKVLLDQLDLSIERRVDYRKNQWDVGGLMEWMWGADAGLIHANGIFDWYDGPRNPQNQFDPVQFYVDVTVPVLNGMRIRAGKFANLVGFESINPTVDFIGFYSRSFVFGTGYPFTHLGVLATLDLNPDRTITFTGGVTRGDDQGFKDDNDSVSFLGSLNWQINKTMALYVANSTGPEQPDNNSDLRTTWDVTFYWQATDRCRFLANGYFIYDAAGASDGGSGYLYSFAALGSYQMCKEATFKVRGEYFHDQDGLRIPAGTSLYEVTVGLDVVPFAKDPIGRNLIIRPELRFDFSDDDVFNGESHQYTLGVDAIFKL
ncbi:MAG TPA: outer membrane beta-barrel protein [Tepidisphaeraceae bacterium]|jgi:hypothetical protein